MIELTVLPLELLGVPVLVSCDDAEGAARVELCYARSTRDEPDPGLGCSAGEPSGAPVEASLLRSSRGWRIEVEGVQVETSAALVDGVRALHHELLHAVMRRCPSCFFVHAGVVEIGGQAVVMPGVSRAGKSTLVLAFLRAGARLLSDEVLAYDPRGGVCRPFPRAVKIRDVCLPYFPEWSDCFQGHGEGRFLPFDALPSDAVAAPTPVGAVVVPCWRGGAATQLQPIARGLALLELTQSTLNFGTHRANSLDHLSDIVRDAQTYRLGWSDPHEAVDLVRERLRSSR